MRTHSHTATQLLAELGLTDGSQLWELTRLPENPTGADHAAAELAMAAAMAIGNIDDADRLAGQKLAHLGELHATETTNRAGNFAGDARWLAQAAAAYAAQLDNLQTAIAAYRAAAHPLARILGRSITIAA